MKIIDIPGGQGSEAWHQHRRDHFNASDAPAMMGCSPYKTRAELVREVATGIVPDVSPETQRLFNDGHRTERLARPLAEAIIGDDLYPIVVASGRLSASLDGATLEGDTLAEFKRLNERLRTAMKDGCTGADLPLDYQVQMEQQLHCANAKRVLFMAAEFGADDKLVDHRHCWYEPNLALRETIIRGWEQFAEDVANYKPAEAAPVVVAAVEHLPAVTVNLTGALTVASNLEPFGVALRAFIERIPKKPSTDQEFADTEAACKRLKEAEDRLQQAEDSALAGMADVEAMRRMVAEFREVARTTRLASEKLVKQRKEQIREEEVKRGADAMRAHLVKLNERLGGSFMPIVAADFPGVIKGLKSLDSVRNAIDTELAKAKIAASAIADQVDANLKAIAAAGSPTLFPDKSTLVHKAPDDLAAIIAQRLAAEQKRQDDERERIRREEAARVAQPAVALEPQTAHSTTLRMGDFPPPAVAATGGPVYVRSGPPTLIVPDAPPINLGEIERRLGFALRRAFIEDTLGITHSHTEKSAVFWPGSAWPAIKAALVEHIGAAQ